MRKDRAADHELTCDDCKYCQKNMKVPNVRIDYYCMREENKQPGYYQRDWMTVNSDFLCNKFDMHEDNAGIVRQTDETRNN